MATPLHKIFFGIVTGAVRPDADSPDDVIIPGPDEPPTPPDDLTAPGWTFDSTVVKMDSGTDTFDEGYTEEQLLYFELINS
jgi:hypothetical protein